MAKKGAFVIKETVDDGIHFFHSVSPGSRLVWADKAWQAHRFPDEAAAQSQLDDLPPPAIWESTGPREIVPA